MVAAQSSYAAKIGTGVIGGKATTSPCKEDVYIASAAVAVGVAVKAVASKPEQCATGIVGAAATPFAATDFLGISVLPPRGEYNQLLGAGGATTALNYPAGDNVIVATEGDFWVQVDGAVTVGSFVTADDTTGELGITAASATHALIPHAIWRTAAADNAMAIVRLSGFIA